MSTLGSLVIRIVGDNSQFNKTIAQTQKTLNSQTKGLRTVARSMTTVGDSMVKGITLPIIAIGAGLAKLGGDLDDAYDKIRTGTGATGKVLEGLKTDFREIAKVAPSSFKDIGIVVADLNTRLGLTGKPLQNLSIQMLNLARITKTDINTLIPATTRAFGDWSIATDKQSKAMDYMYKVSQNTGIGVDVLAEKVTKFGAPLRQMGFDFETSTALIGKWEKEGVNAELVLASLRIALGNFAKEGVKDTNAALIDLIEQIKNAGSVGEANVLAMETFGRKAGPDMAAAIREGRFDLNTLLETLKNGTDTINAASDATMDWKEKLILLRNNIGIALEPLAMKVFDSIGRGIDAVTPKIEALAKWFGNLSPEMQDSLIQWAAMAAIIPVVISGIGRVTTGIIKFRNALLTMNTGLASFAIGGAGFAKALTAISGGLNQFGAQGIPALGLFIDQTGVLRSAVGELGHISHYMTGEMLKYQFTFGLVGEEADGVASKIQNLADVISTQSPEAQAKAMMLFQSYKDGKITIGIFSQELEKLTRLYAVDADVIDKVQLSVDDYKQSLIEQGYTEEKATELAYEHAESLGYVVDEEGNVEEATDDTTESIEEQTKEIEDLTKEFNEFVDDLFGSITTYNDFQEAGWAVEEAEKALAEAIKEHGIESVEAMKAQNNLDDAMIANIKTAFELSQSIDATIVEQEEATKKAIELGLEYVNTGAMGMESFIELASQFGISATDISKIAAIMSSDLDEATKARKIDAVIDAHFYETMMEIQTRLSEIKDKVVNVDINYNRRYFTYGSEFGEPKGGALGGIFTGKEFLRPMVSAAEGMVIPKFDSGGVLAMLHPPEVVLNAKEAMQLIWNMANRPVSTNDKSGGVVMHNTFNSPKPLTEAEIKRNMDIAARELGYRMGMN